MSKPLRGHDSGPQRQHRPAPAAGLWRYAGAVLQRAWRLLRALSGDDAYERYLEHMRAHQPQAKVMSRREYYRYLAQQRGKQDRCC